MSNGARFGESRLVGVNCVEMYFFLAVVGLIGGILAGWVGLGGGIILAPLLLYVPPIVGLVPLDMKQVARLTIIQSLCSTAAAYLAHHRAQQVYPPLVVWMGMNVAIASLGGAFVSELHAVSTEFLLGLFATIALAAAALMFHRPAGDHDVDSGHAPNVDAFSPTRATAVALGVGFLGGMVGQSGAFMTIPLLIHVLRLPTRLAIGSSLGITFCAALAGSLGKILGGAPINWPHVAALVTGSLVGSQLGSALSHRAGTTTLRYMLALVIAACAAGMWYQVLS